MQKSTRKKVLRWSINTLYEGQSLEHIRDNIDNWIEEFGSEAKILIEYCGYDACQISIAYYSEEGDCGYESRIKGEREKEIRELETYNRLKNKYG